MRLCKALSMVTDISVLFHKCMVNASPKHKTSYMESFEQVLIKVVPDSSVYVQKVTIFSYVKK